MRWFKFLLLQIVVLCATITLLLMVIPEHGTIKYDCTWAEISPDIPPKVREECRKLNARKITYTRREGEDRNG